MSDLGNIAVSDASLPLAGAVRGVAGPELATLRRGLPTTALALALRGDDMLPPGLGLPSITATLPALAGMPGGQRSWLRRSGTRCRRVVRFAPLMPDAASIALAELTGTQATGTSPSCGLPGR